MKSGFNGEDYYVFNDPFYFASAASALFTKYNVPCRSSTKTMDIFFGVYKGNKNIWKNGLK